MENNSTQAVRQTIRTSPRTTYLLMSKTQVYEPKTGTWLYPTLRTAHSSMINPSQNCSINACRYLVSNSSFITNWTRPSATHNEIKENYFRHIKYI
jgi:hypothetical protein